MDYQNKNIIIDRAGIEVSGSGARDFLQGLITQDIDKLKTESMIYTAILNQHGRFLFDAFIWRINDMYVLDVAPDPIRTNLIQHLNKYRLRAQVQINAIDVDVQVSLTPPDPAQTARSWVPDPRASEMGWWSLFYPPPERGRWLNEAKTEEVTHTATITPTLPSPFQGEESVGHTALYDYHRRRIERCIPDGVRDAVPGTSTPEELHLPRLNAISFTKGCYLGQELTARIEHRGLGKRHLYTVQLVCRPRAGGDPLVRNRTAREWIPDSAVGTSGMTNQVFLSGKQIGDLRSTCGDIGLALLRDDAIKDTDQVSLVFKNDRWEILS